MAAIYSFIFEYPEWQLLPKRFSITTHCHEASKRHLPKSLGCAYSVGNGSITAKRVSRRWIQPPVNGERIKQARGVRCEKRFSAC
jgi:hypothetical protein